MTIADRVREAVGAVVDPELRKPLAELNMLRDVAISDDGFAQVGIVLTIVGCPAAKKIQDDVTEAASSVEGITGVQVDVGVMSVAERQALTKQLRGGKAARTNPFTATSLTRVIAVSSGKGGVGKSTVTASLAVAFAIQGLQVGVIDADIHGFSIPGLLGIPPHTTPTRIADMIIPPIAYDVRVISIGMFLSEKDAAVAWRGPMLHRSVQQFLTDVHFGNLDILLIDMPPGTGDVAISVGQLLPHAEVLVVTTPQPAAADVAIRSGFVARQTGQRIIGVIETMSPMHLPDGTSFAAFGSGGGRTVSESLSSADETVPLLGSVPFSIPLRIGGDTGTPLVSTDPTDPASAALLTIAQHISHLGRDLAGRALSISPDAEAT